MNILNYFKMDLRLMKKSAKMYAFFPFVAIILLISGNTMIGISYLFLFLLVLNSMPFSLEGKSLKLYYSMPAKISDLVKGRYLFSVAMAACVWVMVSGMMIYSYMNKLATVSGIIALIATGVVMTIVCVIQYPLFYKFGLQKGRVLSMVLYLVPALASMILPSLIKDNVIVSALSTTPNAIFYLIAITLIVICYFVSYLVSYRICVNKEI